MIRYSDLIPAEPACLLISMFSYIKQIIIDMSVCKSWKIVRDDDFDNSSVPVPRYKVDQMIHDMWAPPSL